MGKLTNRPSGKTEKESRVSCRVTASTLANLARIAKQHGISVSDVVRMSLLKVLPLYETTNQIKQ